MKKTSVNLIGLWTIVKRDTARFLRVPVQTLLSPWISALLFIFVFGHVVGSRIDLIAGNRYIDFVLPGILTMNVLTSAFTHASPQVYFQRFIRYIEELLTAPLSYAELLAGYLIVSTLRGLIVGAGILFIAVLFGAASITNAALFFWMVVLISVVFALIGIIVGLWAKGFEQLNILTTFIIMPLSFVGGMFNSIHMLPEWLQPFALANPFFYLMDGVRYAMIGYHEASLLTGQALLIGLAVVLFALVWYLFKIGWRLRE